MKNLKPTQYAVIAMLLIPLVIGFPAILMLVGGPPAFISFIFSGVIAMGAIAYGQELAPFDPSAAQYENVIDMLKGYPNDWEWKDLDDREGYRREGTYGRRYSLHENIIVTDTTTTRYNSDGSLTQGRRLSVRLYDPTDLKVFVDYEPRGEYRKLIRASISDLHKWRELKMLVNVALDAEARQKPSDGAIKALETFRKEKGMQEHS